MAWRADTSVDYRGPVRWVIRRGGLTLCYVAAGGSSRWPFRHPQFRGCSACLTNSAPEVRLYEGNSSEIFKQTA